MIHSFRHNFLRCWRHITTIVGPGNPVPLPLCACLDICTSKTTWSLLPSTLLFVNYLSVERWMICESQPRDKDLINRRRRYWHSIFSIQYSSCSHPSGFFTESSWYVSPRWIYPYYAAVAKARESFSIIIQASSSKYRGLAWRSKMAFLSTVSRKLPSPQAPSPPPKDAVTASLVVFSYYYWAVLSVPATTIHPSKHTYGFSRHKGYQPNFNMLYHIESESRSGC